LGAEVVEMKMPDLGPCEISSAVSEAIDDGGEDVSSPSDSDSGQKDPTS
jgi:hypothetical protein